MEHGEGRVAELAIALSLASDLGTGQPLEHGLRTTRASLAAADALGLDPEDRRCIYYVALLRFLGCTADASETAVAAGGDEIRFNATLAPMMMGETGEFMRFLIRHVAEDLPLRSRMGRVLKLMADPQGGPRSLAQHCEAASMLAARLDLPEPVRQALAHAYERWDGKGDPDGLAGEDVPLAIRVVTVARDAELWVSAAGWAAAAEVLRRRRGRAYDPGVVDVFLEAGESWWTEIDGDLCAAVLDAEPAPVRLVREDRLDAALEAVAHFSDMKSIWFRDHSTGVARLAGDAARAAGLPEEDARRIRRAALLHDVGRIGIASGVWDRPGPLSIEQRERIRLHSYLTERILNRSEMLAPYAKLASGHHERADGTGYHHGVRGKALDLATRILAAADAYHAMCEDRPHRPALSGSDAAEALSAEVKAGRLGSKEVEAVLHAAGRNERPPEVDRPAGLTEREVEVLRLIARGRTNKEVAQDLGISPKTVGAHIEHIYLKAGVRTRAGATLFAMEHELLQS